MSCFKPGRLGDGGFTLVEVLAAVLLLSIGLLAVITGIEASRSTQERTRYLTLARNVAQSEIEKLRSSNPDTVALGTAVTQSSLLPSGNSVTVYVSTGPESAGRDLLYGRATVTWPEGGSTHRIAYETLIVRK